MNRLTPLFLATILSKRSPRVKAEKDNVILTLTCVPFKLNFRSYCIIHVFCLDALLYVFRGCAFPCNDTCPLVPQAASPCPSAMGFASSECRAGLAGGRACMAGGLAEWLRYFNELAVGEIPAVKQAHDYVESRL